MNQNLGEMLLTARVEANILPETLEEQGFSKTLLHRLEHDGIKDLRILFKYAESLGYQPSVHLYSLTETSSFYDVKELLFRMKDIRIKSGLNRKELSRLTGRAPTIIANVEDGHSPALLSVICDIMNTFGIDVEFKINKYNAFDAWILKYENNFGKVTERQKQSLYPLFEAGMSCGEAWGQGWVYDPVVFSRRNCSSNRGVLRVQAAQTSHYDTL